MEKIVGTIYFKIYASLRTKFTQQKHQVKLICGYSEFWYTYIKKWEVLEEQLGLPMSLSDYNLLIQPFTGILRFIAV